MPLSLLRPVRLLTYVLLGLLAAAACAASRAPAAEPSPQARTAAEALAAGRRLVQSGHWDQAAQAYREALADSGDTGLTARVALAALLDRRGSDAEAADLLAPILGGPVSSPAAVRGWFVQGSVQEDLGNAEAAAAAYGRYIELGGPLAAYARTASARVLAATDGERALAVLRPLLQGSGPAHAQRLALKQAGGIEESAGRPEQALAHYEALLALTTWTSERILALDHIGDLRRRLGRIDAAAEALGSLAARYPWSPEAEQALSRLDEIGRPADPLTAGIVHYRRRNNQQARDLFNGYLRENGMSGPGAATALFYLGALAQRRDDLDLTLENYTQAYAADPAGRLAPEALWERARALEGAGRLPEAQADYGEVAARFPASPRAPDAAFRDGMMAYKLGAKAAARDTWWAASAMQDNAGAARAAFWAGRAAGELGDANAATAAYGAATQRDPAGYYGLRAAAVLAGQPTAPLIGRGTLSLASPDWTAAEAWLAGWAGPEDAQASEATTGSEDWQAARELLELGWRRTGTDAAELVIDGRSGQAWPLYRLARAAWEADEPHLAYAAAGRLLALAPAAAPPAAAALARLAYPAPWPEEVQYYAGEYGLDPLLLYAIMRQESTFNPIAGSTAGAFGLTQVIPGTAQEIARALGKTPFAFGDLARPYVAIQFGSYYIGAQLRGFGGNVYQALAAYNGGGTNAARWARPGGDSDIDRFYEEIDFPETRLYLRSVLQNYAWYRYLYGVTPQPSLTGGGR